MYNKQKHKTENMQMFDIKIFMLIASKVKNVIDFLFQNWQILFYHFTSTVAKSTCVVFPDDIQSYFTSDNVLLKGSH